MIQSEGHLTGMPDKAGAQIISEGSVAPKFSSLRSGSKANNHNYLQEDLTQKFKDTLVLGGTTLHPKKLKK